MPDPKPRKTSKSEFKAARPIDSHGIGVLALPILPLVEDLLSKTIFAREAMCLGECHEVLVTIQLPNDLRIAGLHNIQVRNLIPNLARGTFPMHRIQVPVYAISKVEARETQQIKLLPADSLSVGDNHGALIRHEFS